MQLNEIINPKWYQQLRHELAGALKLPAIKYVFLDAGTNDRGTEKFHVEVTPPAGSPLLDDPEFSTKMVARLMLKFLKDRYPNDTITIEKDGKVGTSTKVGSGEKATYFSTYLKRIEHREAE